MDSKSADGERHATFYPIASYPYVAIIDPATGERLKIWSHAITPLEFQSDGGSFFDLKVYKIAHSGNFSSGISGFSTPYFRYARCIIFFKIKIYGAALLFS
jgi:hypothetical protein